MLLTIHHTFSCGHSHDVVCARTFAGPDRTETESHEGVCRACDDTPAWESAGYPSEEAYLDAIRFVAAQREVEQERAARIAEIQARPESERPFRGPPMQGFGTLEDLAASEGEE